MSTAQESGAASPLQAPILTKMLRSCVCVALIGVATWTASAAAQPPPVAEAARGQARLAGPSDTTRGFVISDAATIAHCSGCHVRDSLGHMSRLSYLRKTPEGWETSIRRMLSLNSVRVEPAVARGIVKYLSNAQGLAPEELRPGRFEVERRTIDYRYTADTRTETVCKACHSLGRAITQRRTKEEWELLVATHRGYYPGSDFQGFRRVGPPPPDSAGAPHPMDAAIAHLAKAFPLRTVEWGAWSATMRPPPIDGTWLISGNEPGRGEFFGRLTIARAAAADEFTTAATFRYAGGGPPVSRQGRAVVYTGYQWRGRSAQGAGRAASDTARADDAWREVLFVEPGWQEITGRWFRGGYDEIGADVRLRRLGGSAVLAGVLPRGLRAGDSQEVTIVGAQLPNVAAGAIGFGPGVRVERVVRATGEELVVRLSVDKGAPLGERDISVAGAALPRGAVVYDRVSRIKVTPLAGMARVGGIRFPKQLAQFDAVAYHDGGDGKADTPDDLEIGRVGVTWSLEEYGVTFDDDDIKFVGSIDAKGLFTPNVDGPNSARSGSRNNIGDVWVVATFTPPEPAARPIKARAHLLVTVPLYMRWDPWSPGP
ncbi:MAG: quinohemoprotein amine dehydrogenase subunit alpha [Gemmatimonadaceae bacterium]